MTVIVVPGSVAVDANQSVTAIAAADGHWAVRFTVTPAGNPHSIEISSHGKKRAAAPILLTDVLAGEVHSNFSSNLYRNLNRRDIHERVRCEYSMFRSE